MSAFAAIAALRCFAVPITMDTDREDRWSHLAASALQVLRATDFGAMTRTLSTSRLSFIRRSTAVRVLTVLPSPMSRNRAQNGWAITKSVALF